MENGNTNEGAAAIMMAVRAEHQKLDRENPGSTHFLAKLEGRKATPDEARRPLRIAVAADLSGSMAGRKIDYLQSSLQALVRQLGPQDKLAIIGFSTTVWTVAGPTACGGAGRALLDGLIDRMIPTASTNLSGGAIEAIAQLRGMMDDADAEGAIGRVLLMTDGLPNEGVREPGALVELLRKACGGTIRLSAFGYGGSEGSYDPDLLSAIARACGGDLHHIEGTDGVAQAIGRELGSLMTVVAQSVRLRITPGPGVAIERVLNDLDAETQPDGSLLVRLDDAYAEQESAVVLRARIAPGPSGVRQAVAVRAEWIDATTGAAESAEQAVDLDFVAPGAQDKSPDPEVEKQVALLVSAEEQRAAVEAADRRDFEDAKRRMDNALTVLASCSLYGADDELGRVHRVVARLSVEFDASSYGAHAKQRAFAMRRSLHRKSASMAEPELQFLYDKGGKAFHAEKMRAEAEERQRMKEEMIRQSQADPGDPGNGPDRRRRRR